MSLISRNLRRKIAPRLDIPFARDDANRYLPWFISLMIFLAAFFVSGGITIGELLHHKEQSSIDWVSIQLPAQMNSEDIEALNSNFQKVDFIDESRIIDSTEISEMLSPWLGDNKAVIKQLELPQMIEVRLLDRNPSDLASLKAMAVKANKDAEIDDHEVWLSHYLNFTQLLQWGTYLIAFLVVMATTVIIIFTSKTALKLHKEAIWLLHSVGAEDEYIARQFQFNAFLLGTRGGLIGVACAAILFFIVGLSVNEMETSLLPNFPITLSHLLVWLFIPPLTGILALFVARKTVLAMLQKLA